MKWNLFGLFVSFSIAHNWEDVHEQTFLWKDSFYFNFACGGEGNAYLMLQLRPEEGVGGPGAEMKGMWARQHGCWEQNLSLLQQHLSWPWFFLYLMFMIEYYSVFRYKKILSSVSTLVNLQDIILVEKSKHFFSVLEKFQKRSLSTYAVNKNIYYSSMLGRLSYTKARCQRSGHIFLVSFWA